MGGNLPSRFGPLAWHIHEMLFGFVMQRLPGSYWPRSPNWTGRAPISGCVDLVRVNAPVPRTRNP